MSLSLPGRMEISVQEHEKIIDAFRRKDAELAETLVRKNAEYGGRVLMERYGICQKQLNPSEFTSTAEADTNACGEFY